MKKKIAFIVQRYGLEVNGGAEFHCRTIAEKLKDLYQVEILTSCAKDYTTWANDYPAGVTLINGIPVHRFSVAYTRDKAEFRSIGRKLVTKRKPYQKILRLFGLLKAYERHIPLATIRKDEARWLELQGPYLPNLVEYIRENQNLYDAFIFFTYLYYPTVYGLQVAPEKSILIPTAHDEPQIYLRVFKEMFNMPAAILYNTESEKRLVNKLTGNSVIYSDIAGLGIEISGPKYCPDTKEIVGSYNKYLIYIGRVDVVKGCGVLIDDFIRYKTKTKNPVKLILIGQVFMNIPANDDIIIMGFVDEAIKIALLTHARALVIPSLYESLSLVTLESMAYGIPVIANEKCEVLKDHIQNSRAGFLYNNYESFKAAVDKIFDPGFDTTALSRNAKKYIAENYSWAATIQKFQKAIDYVSRH